VVPTLAVGAKWLGQKAHPHRRRFTKPNQLLPPVLVLLVVAVVMLVVHVFSLLSV